jgi:rhamnosyltransferase
MSITILLATYNGESYIAEQLDSIISQTYSDWTLFVSDDQSTDNTLNIVRSYIAKDNRIQMLEGDARFGYAGANFFRLVCDVNIENCEYVAFSDQDDIWLPDKLERAAICIQTKKIDGYSSNALALWPNGNKNSLNKAQPQTRLDYLFEAASLGCSYVVTKKLMQEFKKNLLENKEIAKKIFHHDWLIYAFARHYGFKWCIDKYESLLYRQTGFNETGANIGLSAIKKRLKKITSSWYFKQCLLIMFFLKISDKNPHTWLTRLSIVDRLMLIKNSIYYRRKMIDKFALALIFLVYKKT